MSKAFVSKKGRKGKRMLIAREAGIPVPPPFFPTLLVTHRFRFDADNAGTLGIAWSDMCKLMVVATTATSATGIYSTVKLNSVTVWGPPASDLVPVTIKLEWDFDSDVASNSRIVTDTSVGASRPAYLKAVPPISSAQSLWHKVTDDDDAFTLTYVLHTIIDVVVTLAINDDSQSGVIASSGMTPGVMYYICLDGPSGHLKPLGATNVI